MSEHLTPKERVLQIAAPQVFAKVQNLHAQFPELNGRALQAGFLAVGGAVHSTPGMPDTYHVTSSRGTGNDGHPDFYVVQLDAHATLQRGTCTCPDYLNGIRGLRRGAPSRYGGPKCKHIIAVAFVRAVEREQEAADSESDSDDLPPQEQWRSMLHEERTRVHNLISGFTRYCRTHPEYVQQRWGISLESGS